MQDNQTVALLKALADKTRLEIVRKLAQEDGEAPCAEVSNCSSLSQPAMSHHFSKLADAGVVLEHRKGKEKIYSLNTELLQASGIDIYRL